MSDGNAIRDFIYLDIERIRSFVAQMSQGLPSERTSETGKEMGGEGSVEGGLLFAKLKGGTDFRYLKSDTETKSLHDHIFEEFLQGLAKRKLLISVPDDNVDWSDSNFEDGGFILAKGVFKIVDYRATVESLQNASNLMKLIVRIVSKTGTTNSQQQVADAKRTSDQLKDLPLKDMVSFVDQFYGELIRVKIFPFPNIENRVFVGTTDRHLFRHSLTALTGLYGSVIDANWQCLLQVSKGSPIETQKYMSQGSQIEDKVENLADILTSLTTLTQGIKFPAIGVIPIAIYRSI
ncbi:MAG: hypothetical protein R3E39_16760 [Anaerolineae bacterium]